MKSLLRSVFRVQPTESEKETNNNFSFLISSGLTFDLEEDQKIWDYVKTFYQANGHTPMISSIRNHFERGRDPSIIDRLEQSIVSEPVRTKGDYLVHLQNVVEDKRCEQIVSLSKEMVQIIRTGLEIQDKRERISLKGSADAVKHFMDKGSSLLAPATGGRLSGNVMKDGDLFKKRYEQIELDPSFGMGQYCGIKQIDDCFRGAQKKKLWIHAAWPGHLKSSFALHWAYVQSVYFGYPSLYFSLEMPYEEQVLNYIYTMHSAHEDFAEVRQSLGIEGLGLNYEKIKYGELSRNEKEFLFKFVVPDLNKEATVEHIGAYSLDPKDYGDLLIDCYDPDKADFTVDDLRAKADILYQQIAFRMIFVDHALLMEARRKYSNTTDKLNEVVKDLKRLAMSFNHGEGTAVVALWQISRPGYDHALKNDGMYNMLALNYCNECITRATKIPSDHGILPIERIEPGFQVWSRSGWKTVLNRFDQGKKQIWRVETDRGAVLEATENHRIRVLRGEEIQWEYVKNLIPGDWVVSTKGDYPWATETPTLSHESCPHNQMTEDLAYLLGAWDGDGTKRATQISFTGNRKETTVRQKINDTFFSVFGESLVNYNFKSRPGSFDDTSLVNKNRTKWFESLAGERGKEVPEIIFRSPRRFILAYLQGLWDTDGWINSNNVIGIQMKSKEFISQIQNLMTLLGYETILKRIETTLKKTGKTYEGWFIRIQSYESRLLFSKEIGFREPWKRDRLIAALQLPIRKGKTTIQVYPISNSFSELYESYIKNSIIAEKCLCEAFRKTMIRVRKTKCVPRQPILNMIKYLDENNISDFRAEKMRHILSLHVCQIKSVVQTDRVEDVFDLEVDGDHEFQTGPLLSHNCEKSADVITAAWFGDDVRNINRALIQNLKARDEKPFDRFAVRVEPECRRILTDLSTMEDINAEREVANADNINGEAPRPPVARNDGRGLGRVERALDEGLEDY